MEAEEFLFVMNGKIRLKLFASGLWKMDIKKVYPLIELTMKKNYEPSNCRWTDEITQQNNRTNNTLYEYEGETHTLTEWSRIKGIKPKTFCTRWRRGYRGQDLMKPTMTKSEVGRKYGGIRH